MSSFLSLRSAGWVSVAVAALLAACTSSPTATSRGQPSARVRALPTSQAQRYGSDWLGRFRAEVPCINSDGPQCARQSLMLSLEPGNRYALTTTTIHNNGQNYSVTSRARYTVEPDGQTIVLASKDENTRLRFKGGNLVRVGRAGLTETEAAAQPLVFSRL